MQAGFGKNLEREDPSGFHKDKKQVTEKIYPCDII
jgi:hypothetical protein